MIVQTIRFWLFLSLMSFCLYVEAVDSLKYSIRPQMQEEKQTLLISLQFQGNASGITEVLLPSSWAGQQELYGEIHNLHCSSLQTTVEDTEEPALKKIHHPPNGIVQLSYQVIPKSERDFDWYYRPIIQESHFFFFGHCLFIVPKTDDMVPIAISIEWQNFPEHWSLANSFASQNQKQELFLPISTFLHAVYVGGDFHILKCGKEDSPIYIAIRGEWSFSTERLTHLIQTVIESHRDFWNDHDFPYYLIAVIPTENDYYMGGTGLSQSFSIFIGDLSEDSVEDWRWLGWLLSHENFHTWNGIKMMSSPPEGSLFWFTEGFTEYYAVKLNYLSKLISLDDYVEHINTIMYDYFTSSVHNAPNEKIQKDFWNDREVQRLPYVRGFLFALEWDHKIRTASSGQYNLDHFMWKLYEKTQKNEGTFSLGDIEQVASTFLPLELVQQDLKSYISDGDSIIPADSFTDDYSLQWLEDIGFQLLQTISMHRIEGVKIDSKAFLAGLRNGQSYIGFENRDGVINVHIKDRDGSLKTITYLKDPAHRMIPQYTKK